MEATINKRVLALLLRGRKWFERPNSTVKDWGNYVERDSTRKICRKCIYGAIGFNAGPIKRLPEAQVAASKILDTARTMTYYRPVVVKHTRREVLAIYDKAIELAGAKP
jgi:hypothetical protein